MNVLISVDELRELPEVVLLDVRWMLGGPPGHQEYRTGHIPGAVFVDLETELAAHGEPTDGRHPLPSLPALQASARRWGVREGVPVVAYDGNGNLAAARAWWLLRWAGVPDVRLLDGALAAWVTAGGDLDVDDVVPEPSDIVLTGGELPTLDLDAVQGFDGVLLDARAGERYRGETEPIDPEGRPHPRRDQRADDREPRSRRPLPDADELRERFSSLGVGDDPTGVYCGSGVTAAHEIAALAVAGYDAALYAGSWSQWSNHDDLPVATGTG